MAFGVLTLGVAVVRAFAYFTLVLLLVGCGESGPIKIGFIGGLSGRSADIGEASRNAVQLAVEGINEAGGIDGRQLELLVRDDQDDPDVAAAAVRDLHENGVVAIIGPNNSSIAEGMLPVLNELELVAISPTVSSLVFAGLDDHLFRINWTTRDNAQIYATHYAERGIVRVAAAIDNNNRVFSQSWLDEFTRAFEAAGGALAGFDVFDADDERGYSQTASRLLEFDADALLLIANGVDTAQLAQQIRKLDEEILLIAAEWAASERLLHLGGGSIEGLELVQSYDRNDQSERYVAFKDAFAERFNQYPGYAGIAAYDAATVLFQALAEQEDGTLRQALLDQGGVQGLQQTIDFDEYGDAQRRAFFVVVRGGNFVMP